MADELKIWALRDGSEAQAVESVSGVKLEDTLEETLVQRPQMLENGLHLIGRQTPTESGPLDLLGVDASGRLVVFELKRGSTTREAVTQCIDYASALDAMEPEALAKHVAERSGTGGIDNIDDLEEWYLERFADNALGDLQPPRLVLVGLGTDERAERMARFLSASGLDISVLTFYGFKQSNSAEPPCEHCGQGGETLLARQVEVDHETPTAPRRRNPGAAEKEAELQDYLDKHELTSLFNAVYETLLSEFPGAFRLSRARYAKALGLSFIAHTGRSQNIEICRVFVENPNPQGVGISLRKLAIERYGEQPFENLTSQIKLTARTHDHLVAVRDEAEWDQKRGPILEFMQGVDEAWNRLRRTPAPKPD